eukprot:SAG31_NODE_1177_length_9532_cov_6.655465_4_plen_222_part_00
MVFDCRHLRRHIARTLKRNGTRKRLIISVHIQRQHQRRGNNDFVRSPTEIYFVPQNSDSHITRWRLFWKLDVNDTLWGGPGFPIFLYIGGEGPESGGAVSGELFISRLAEEHQALLVDLEHRFYGESHPTADMSDDNLKYLTSLQALEDLSGCAFLSSLEMFLCSARHGCAACLYPAMLCCTCKALLAGLAQDGVINQELAQAHGSALAAATPVTYRPGSD